MNHFKSGQIYNYFSINKYSLHFLLHDMSFNCKKYCFSGLFNYFSGMNLLAHVYLSGNNDFIKIGNFIADGIHGKNYSVFPPDVQKGIILHRAIDTYTDSHVIFKQSTKKLHANYGHYSGVIVDILYDHFLAKNWHVYSAIPLDTFVANFYSILKNNLNITPERTQKIFPHMVKNNWLYSYRNIEGISDILYQMDSRTGFKSNMQHAPTELQLHYTDFEMEFSLFFEDMISHVQQHHQIQIR